MSDPVFLCTLEDLSETGAFGTQVSFDGKDINLVVVIDQVQSNTTEPMIRAFKNVCPHKMTPLETFPNEFLDKEDPSYLVCSTHGARFQVSDGLCVTGPCLTASLAPLEVTLRKNEIFLTGG